MRRSVERRFFCLACAGVISLASARGVAMEVDFGASVGGMMAGNVPRFAVSPHAGLSWPLASVFVFEVHDMVSLLLAANSHGPGIYDHLSALAGFAWKDGKIVLGPSLSAFDMPACGPIWCARVSGVGAGAQARADLFFWGPAGLSLSGTMDVPLQSVSVLPGGPTWLFLAGAVFRVR